MRGHCFQRRSGLVTALLAYLVAALVPVASEAQVAYEFEEIASTDGPFSFIFEASIDENGAIAFKGTVDGSGERLAFLGRGDEVLLEDYVVLVQDPYLFPELYEFDNGRLAFSARRSGNNSGSGTDLIGIATESGVAVAFWEQDISDSATQSAQIEITYAGVDDAGEVLWTGRSRVDEGTPLVPPFRSGDFDYEVFAGRRSLFRDISLIRTTASILADESGAVYYLATSDSSNPYALRRNNQQLLTVTDLPASMEFFKDFSVADNGNVIVFAFSSDRRETLISFDNETPPTVIVDANMNDSNFDDLHLFTSNNFGEVVFEATTKDGQRGIFRGPDPELDAVLIAGDSLFGSTVQGVTISRDALNDLGQLALRVTLEVSPGEFQFLIVRANPDNGICNSAAKGSVVGCSCEVKRQWLAGESGNFSDPDNWVEQTPPSQDEGAEFDTNEQYSVNFGPGDSTRCLDLRQGEVQFSGGQYDVSVASLQAAAHLKLENHHFSPTELTSNGSLTINGGGNLSAEIMFANEGTTSVNSGGELGVNELVLSTVVQAFGQNAVLTTVNDAGQFQVGFDADGIVDVASQAKLNPASIGIGGPNAAGQVTVTDASADIDSTVVGGTGPGTLTVIRSTFHTKSLEIAGGVGGSGTMAVEQNSTVLVGDAGGRLILGEQGQGTLNLRNSELTLASDGSLLGIIGGEGTGIMELVGSTLSAPGWAFTLGRVTGGQGTIQLLDQSLMTIADLSVGNSLFGLDLDSRPGANMVVRASELQHEPAPNDVAGWFDLREYVGVGPRGRLDLIEGGVINSKFVMMDGDSDHTNRAAAVISGPDSVWNAEAWIVGNRGRANLIIENRGQVNVTNQFIAGGEADVTLRAESTLNTGDVLIGVSGFYEEFSELDAESKVTLEDGNAVWNAADIDISPEPFAAGALNHMGARPGRLVVGAGATVRSNIIRLQAGGRLAGDGGTISILQGNGQVLNQGGTVAPGASPGTLIIEGHYEQAAGTLEIELAGLSENQVDLLQVSGTAQLSAGRVLFIFRDYAPSQDDTFMFLNAGGIQLGDDLEFEVYGLEPGFEFGVAVNLNGTLSLTALNDGEIEGAFFVDGFELE